MEQDFLNKQIEQLASELDSLVIIMEKSKKQGREFEGLEKVDKGLMENLNINLEEINNIPIEHFMATITVDSQLNNSNLDKLGNLFFVTAKVLKHLKEKESSKRLFTRTLQIYLYLAKIEVEFPFERHIRIKELREILLQ
jgi:hypothetical protein